MASDRAKRLRRLARTLTDRFGLASHRHGVVEAEWSGCARAWTFAWTDGPTVAQVRAACRETEPVASEGLRYARSLSQDAVALGAVRLTILSATTATGGRPRVRTADVEALWRDRSRRALAGGPGRPARVGGSPRCRPRPPARTARRIRRGRGRTPDPSRACLTDGVVTAGYGQERAGTGRVRAVGHPDGTGPGGAGARPGARPAMSHPRRTLRP